MLPKTLSSALIPLAFNLLALSLADAYDLSGKVTTKLNSPIASAQVCLAEDSTHCVFSTGGGAFQITDASIGVLSSGKVPAYYGLDLIKGNLSMTIPVAIHGHLQWLDAVGKLITPALAIHLPAGRHALNLPGTLEKNGLYFARLSTPAFTLVWKILLMEGVGTGQVNRMGSDTKSITALSKVSAYPPTLKVSKDGFRNAYYYPSQEMETDVEIRMADKTDTGFFVEGQLNFEVESIDRVSQRMVVKNVHSYCDVDSLITESNPDTNLYAIRDGKLYLWNEGDCSASIMRGASEDVVGTWSFKFEMEKLPLDLNPMDCQVDESAQREYDFNANAVYNISNTRITGTFSTNVCPLDNYYVQLSGYMDSTQSLTRNTCQGATIKNVAGKSLDLSFTAKSDTLIGTLTYPGGSCKITDFAGFRDRVPTCPEVSPERQLDNCIIGSGFFTSPGPSGGPVLKQSAMGIGKKAHRSAWY